MSKWSRLNDRLNNYILSNVPWKENEFYNTVGGRRAFILQILPESYYGGKKDHIGHIVGFIDDPNLGALTTYWELNGNDLSGCNTGRHLLKPDESPTKSENKAKK